MPQRRSGLPASRVSWRARPPELDEITSGIKLQRRKSSGKALEYLLEGQKPRKRSFYGGDLSKILIFYFEVRKLNNESFQALVKSSTPCLLALPLINSDMPGVSHEKSL